MHGEELGGYAYGMWTVVIFNTLLILFFVISYMVPKKNIEWRSMGAFIGFIVALFTEMYGFPLTIYLLSSWMGKSYPVLNPFTHNHGHLILVFLGLADFPLAMTTLHIVSNGLIFFGLYIIYQGWMLIYAAQGKKLVTEGVYSYVRHPQYAGLFLVTVGFLLQWPSITTLIMWPILMFSYYRLALREEIDVEKIFGKQYEEYRKRVPAFIPKFKKGGIQ